MFDLTLVRREVEHVPLRPMALTLGPYIVAGKRRSDALTVLLLYPTRGEDERGGSSETKRGLSAPEP